MLKGIINKLFKAEQKPAQSEVHHISTAEIEALVDAKIKEHAKAMQTTISQQSAQKKDTPEDDYTLTAKQIDYAVSIINKTQNEYVLAMDPSKLTIKDLNRLIAYQRYKNKGILINLAKKGVLKKS